jgi:anaerobic selenocysteine-containing dehydrogenase
MPARRTVCPLDCPDRCSLEVAVEHGRVASIGGRRADPVTRGFICAKVRRYAERVHGPDRLLHPLKRVGPKGGGRFTRVSWEEALDTAAARLREARDRFGGESILPFAYGGSNGLLSQGLADERLFRALGASRLERTVCAAQTGLVSRAMYGGMPGAAFADVRHARFVLLWGGNPKASNVHLLPFLKEAREAGAKAALVDPRRTLGREWIDWHLPVRPGADAAVALAMIAHLERCGLADRAFLERHTTGAERLLEAARAWTLERAAARAGVPARDIAEVAEAYAGAEPAFVRCGWGLERNRNGEAAVAAALALPLVAGKFGRRGGGYALSTGAAFRVDGDRLAGGPPPTTRSLNMSRLGRILLEEEAPPVAVLFVYDANPAVTLPDQERVLAGLRREDLFTVVFDQVLTDTAREADLVLPATTFLEHAEVSTSYGTGALGLGEPVIPPVGEARPNAEVFRLLAERLGIDPGPRGDETLLLAVSAVGAPLVGEDGGGVSAATRLRRLRETGVLRLAPEDGAVPFADVFPGTLDGRAHLWPEELGPEPYRVHDDPASPAFPLALISPSSDRSVCSTLGEYGFKEGWVDVHPEDAAARGLADGARVRVRNALGEVVVRVRLSREVRPGVVSMPKGLWNRHTESGRVSTALVPDFVSPLSGGACFNDARVELSAAG